MLNSGRRSTQVVWVISSANKHYPSGIACYGSHMEETDARKLSQDVQYALRKQIVRLRKQGRPNQEVAKIVGATVVVAN